MISPLRIGIVGYGTAGQAAALLLSRDGHRVDVFERASVAGPGWCGLPAAADRASGAVGAGPARRGAGARRASVAPVRRDREGAAGDGHALPRAGARACSAWVCSAARCSVCSMWPGRKDGASIAAVASSRSTQKRGVLRDEAGVRARCIRPGDRRRWRRIAAAQPGEGAARLDRPYPWGAQWCLVPRDGWAWADELRQRYVGARRMAGMLPVGTRPGDPTPRLSFFWSVPVTALRPGRR